MGTPTNSLPNQCLKPSNLATFDLESLDVKYADEPSTPSVVTSAAQPTASFPKTNLATLKVCTLTTLPSTKCDTVDFIIPQCFVRTIFICSMLSSISSFT